MIQSRATASPQSLASWQQVAVGVAILGVLCQAVALAHHLHLLWAQPKLRFLVALPIVTIGLAVLGMRGKTPTPIRQTRRLELAILLAFAGAIGVVGSLYRLPWCALSSCVILMAVVLLALLPNYRTSSVLSWCTPLFVLLVFPTSPEFDADLWTRHQVLQSASIMLDTMSIPNMIQKDGELHFLGNRLQADFLFRLFVNPYLQLAITACCLAFTRIKFSVFICLLCFVFPFSWAITVLHAIFGVWCFVQQDFNIFAGSWAIIFSSLNLLLVAASLLLTLMVLQRLWTPVGAPSSGAAEVHRLFDWISTWPNERSKTKSDATNNEMAQLWGPKPLFWSAGLAGVCFVASGILSFL